MTHPQEGSILLLRQSSSSSLLFRFETEETFYFRVSKCVTYWIFSLLFIWGREDSGIYNIQMSIVTARVRSTREGNVLTSVCPSIHPSVCPQGGVRYPPRGVQVPPGGSGTPPGGPGTPPGGPGTPRGGQVPPLGGSRYPPGGVRVPPGGVQVKNK